MSLIARDLVDPALGIALGCRIIPVDPGSPAVFNASVRMTSTTAFLGHQCHPNNGGAGLDEISARNAAIGEATERYCVSVVDRRVLRFGSYRQLADDGNPLHPDEVALFADFQSDTLPRGPFTEESPLAWIRGRSLLDGRERLVPACLVHIPYHASAAETIIGPAISTGLACGADPDAAICSGLYESIERDAFCIVWLNRLQVPRIALDEPPLRELFRRRFERPGLDYFLFAMQFDFSAPTVLAIVRDRNFDPPLWCIGGACRIDVRKAAEKALVEVVQGWMWARHERLTFGPMARPENFDEIRDFSQRVRLYACADMQEALSFLIDSPDCRPLSSYPRPDPTPGVVIPTLLSEMQSAGSDVITINLTTRDVAPSGLVVMKTYCPYLQQVEGDHGHRLLGGRRWRDVPVRYGHRAVPLEPEELNPFPHPYP